MISARGRQRQAGDVALEQFDRRAVDAAVIFVFAFGLRKARRRDQEQQRIDAVSGGDRHRLAHLPPFLAVERGVLAGRGIDADLARAFDHHAIGADIDAAGLRALRHHRVAGAEIKPAVERPHALRRKLPDVDLVARHDVLVADRGFGRTSLGFMVRPIFFCSACTALSGWSIGSSPIIRQNRDRLQPIML